MKVFRHIYNIGTRILALLLLFCWQACSTTDSDDPQQPSDGRVAVELALSVSTNNGNPVNAPRRMASSTVQAEGVFRGIQDIRLIPLNSEREVAGEMQKDLTPSGNANAHYYFSNHNVELYIGTSRFLGYARAIPDEDAKLADNGCIDDSSFPASVSNIDLSAIQFKPKQICPSEEDDGYEVARTLAGYLTQIANVENWNSREYKLGNYYTNFINKELPIAGSTANVKAMIAQLRDNLSVLSLTGVDENVRLALIKKIDEINSEIESKTDNPYPANIGLPDGAGAMVWLKNESKFDVLINAPEGSSMPLSDHDRYAYPPELYYFADSPIKSSTGQREGDYNNGQWDEVLATYNYDNATVEAATRSVAVKNPLEYAVGCLELNINAASSSLEDNSQSANVEDSSIEIASVNLGTVDEKKFPLTGIQIDGQYLQTYEFMPEEDTKDDAGHTIKKKEYIVYDKSIDDIYLTESISGLAHMLAFQSRDGKPVHIVLEFKNNSGKPFYGYNNGIVYNGTKFYLIGQIWPDGESAIDKERRVFTKDFKTTLNLTVNSLKNAYNVIPDLKTAAFAIHVSNVAIRNWEDLTPVDHDLYNW